MKKNDGTASSQSARKSAGGAQHKRVPRARSKWRVEIINENTLSKAFSWRLSGIKARLALIAAVASIVSLVVVIFTLTPVGRWIWGQKDLRNQYVEMALRLDSLNIVAARQEAYAANIRAILSDTLEVDSIVALLPLTAVDTLMSASEAEKRFVEQFENENRFNLSVLSPVLAEGMIFESPVREVGVGGPVMAVYRGTVVALDVSLRGRYSVVVQHPNDFLSVYGGLANVYVAKGAKVVAGQRIGTSDSPLEFELWRGGTLLQPENYITFPVPASIEQ